MDHTSLSTFLHGLDSENYVLRENVSFQTLTSFRTGGTCAFCLAPKTIPAFCEALRLFSLHSIPYLLLGHGTNVLAPDDGYPYVVLLTEQLKEVKQEGNTITAEAGVLMNALATAACKASLSGLEFSYGIPGSVGGALCMNAGAYEHAIDEVVISVLACDRQGNLQTIENKDCAFAYRESVFQKEGLIALSAVFTLTPDCGEDIRARMDDYLSRRKKSQPLEYPSAGSFFRRPPGHFAGKLIQDCNLKGVCVGGAMVSEKHAGFLINYQNATSSDVKELAKLVQDKVQETFGVTLCREVEYLLDDDE